jgi:hypothetical protein
MSGDGKGERTPRPYGEYLRFTAAAPLNMALALVYLAVAVACFVFSHTVFAAVVLVGGVVIWLRPAYYVGWKLRQPR